MRIVYFDIDCLRPDHLGCYGYKRPTSPTLDAIARQGVCLNNYYCSSSPCLPSRTVLTSGRFGIRNGVVSNHGAGARFHLRTNQYVGPLENNEMLMRRLRAYGWDAVCFSNFADRHNALWFMYGWSEFHTPNLKGGDETAEEVNSKVLPWLKQNARRDNLYLHINYWDVHRCYKMPSSWGKHLEPFPVDQPWPDGLAIESHQSYKGAFTAQNQFDKRGSPFPLMPSSVFGRRDFEQMIHGYDTAIAYVDHHIKQVLDELDSQGILDETAIIISGDHGDAFGEHGIYSDHVCADECIHHIPFIMKWPGVAKPGHHPDALLYNVDYAPTLCDILGIPSPSDWDGVSFVPHLKNESGGPARDYLVWDCGLYAVQRAVRTRTHLMIRTYDSLGYSFDPVELYDMIHDPFQTRNLSDEQRDTVDRCSRLMTDWVQEQLMKSDPVSDPLISILEERKMS